MMNQALEQRELDKEPALDANQQQTDTIQLWLVDDSNSLRDSLAELLERCPQIKCTRGFSSANAALSALASRSGPDVILLDIQMGQENGLDAVRPIKSLSRSTRVIMLTTFYDTHSRSRAMSDGASGFLLKRYPVEEMVESIRRARSEPVSYPAKLRSHPNTFDVTKEPAEPKVARGGLMPAKSPEPCSSLRRHAIIQQCLGLFRNFRN
jgi:DNA-binding NarL/FixJ family response regulator